MKKIEIKLNIIPPTATSQQKGEMVRNGKIIHFKKANVRRAENDYIALLSAHPSRPVAPIKGPVSVSYDFRFPYRKSEKKSNLGRLLKKTTKPDLDNMVKLLQDCMTRLNFWADDAQIYAVTCEKYWDQEAYVHILITYDFEY